MKKAVCVCLVSKSTGKRYYFDRQVDADKFLGRSQRYAKKSLIQGSPITNKDGEQFVYLEIANRVVEYRTNPDRQTKKEQKCTSCARAYSFCSWSRRLEPVEGWTAEQSFDADGDPYSYHVIDCPLYEEDAKTPAERRKQIERLRSEIRG